MLFVVEPPMLRVDDGWLVTTQQVGPEIRLDARVLDRVLAADDHLVMSLRDLTVKMFVPGGPHVAAQLATELGRYTHQPRAGACVLVGTDPVRPAPPYVSIGSLAFRINEIQDYALRGANVPLDVGVVQAALVLVAIEAESE